NYPNPFNSNTEIQYYLSRATEVKVAVYNSLGEKVKTIFSDYTPSGFHTIYWDSKDETSENVSSGLYFYQIIAENRVIVRKMMLLR
ncbi:T9SS type A sorting domain-containing protein, partial [candidate division KSB1 bacterium]|nr:T9SS type A sorting domain-containing protein [candidate division KSB1 bacterium]